MNPSSQRYSPLSIALHWLTVLLMIAIYASIELRELFPKGSDPREMLKSWHFMLGLLLPMLVLLRIWARKRHPAPPITPEHYKFKYKGLSEKEGRPVYFYQVSQ